MTKRLKTEIGWVVLAAALIFLHSAMPADLSGAESGFFVRWLRGALAAAGLGVDGGLLTLIVRKTAHFVEFAFLGFCLGWLLRDAPGGLGRRSPVLRAALAWCCGAVYAVSDELHQLFVAGRSCEMRDVAVDCAGVLCGVVLTQALARLSRDKK